MKKLFYVFAFSLMPLSLMAAPSTCETRVDKHQDASTAQRVEYCLTEDPADLEETPATEVILSDVYSVQYPKKKVKKAAAETEEIKTFNPGPTSMEYLDRDDYPAFRNDILPIMNEDEAHKIALEALSSVEPKENKGKKSLKRPGRVMKSKPAEEVAPVVTDTASYADPAYAAPANYGVETTQQQPYAAAPQQMQAPADPVQTPPAEIAQAQALENDPLAQGNAPEAGLPTGFSTETPIDSNNFGYNATDPALQP